MMQLVPEKFSACWSAMAIIDTKKWTLRPIFMLSVLWFSDVENNSDSIFIIVSHQTHISVCCICSNNSISPSWSFTWVVMWYHYSCTRLKLKFSSFIIFRGFVYHLVDIQCSKRLGLLVSIIVFRVKHLLKLIFTNSLRSSDALRWISAHWLCCF